MRRRLLLQRCIIALFLLALFTGGIVWRMRRETERLRLNHDLVAAVKRRDKQAVQVLLEAGADANARDRPLESVTFMRAVGGLFRPHSTDSAGPEAFRFPPALIRLLSVRPQGEFLQEYIPPPEEIDIVKLLVDHGADVNARDRFGNTPLILAVNAGYEQTARLLLEHKADPNANGATGVTPLMVANGSLIRLLLRYGAKTEILDRNGATALILACADGRNDAIAALMASGADVNARAYMSGLTPLLAAISRRLPLSTVRLLVEKGADINAADNGGRTALMQLASSHNEDMIRYLLAHGANVNAKDEAGKTAHDWASAGSPPSVSLLVMLQPHVNRTDHSR